LYESIAAVFATSMGKMTASAVLIISSKTLSGYKETETPSTVRNCAVDTILGISVPFVRLRYVREDT
jgi:hypothetical protein